MYSHCEDLELGKRLPELQQGLLSVAMEELLGHTSWQTTRLCTYLQGSVMFLDEDAEFRVHLWFSLPDGHKRFPAADRGMACFIQPVAADGLYGPVYGQVSWLGSALAQEHPEPDPQDWIGVMIRDQGYLSIEDSEWGQNLNLGRTSSLMASFLAQHLKGMVSRRILEEELEDDR